MVIPILCNFGGMMYGFNSSGVTIWHSYNYSECSEMCKDTNVPETKDNAGIEQLNFISKIWKIGMVKHIQYNLSFNIEIAKQVIAELVTFNNASTLNIYSRMKPFQSYYY